MAGSVTGVDCSALMKRRISVSKEWIAEGRRIADSVAMPAGYFLPEAVPKQQSQAFPYGAKRL
jgi:hypothetical protein